MRKTITKHPEKDAYHTFNYPEMKSGDNRTNLHTSCLKKKSIKWPNYNMKEEKRKIIYNKITFSSDGNSLEVTRRGD